MKTNFVLLLLLIVFLASCWKEKNNDTTLTADAVAASTDTIITEKSTADKGISELKLLTNEFISGKKEVEKQLKTLSKTEANKLYQAYYEKSFEVIGKIDKKEHLLLENYYSYFYNEENRGTPPDSIRQKEALLKNAGLKFSEDGEGGVYVAPHHLFYYSIFKNYVTDDYREYIYLEAKDNEKLWNADAGIGITWKELGDKVRDWENFVKKYPHSVLFSEANNTYLNYQYYFLFGMDNTPVMETVEGSTNYNEIYPEIKKDLEGFIKDHPESPTSKRVKRILDNEGKDYTSLQEDILRELKIK